MTRILLLAFLLFPVFSIHSQAQLPVKEYVQQIAKGWTTDAKTALPDLLIDRPDDPAVMFLHASLVEEPERAMPLYERIVKNHAQNEWADDALLRLIMFAVSRKEADKAKKLFKDMRDVYPASDLLPVANDLLRMTVGAPPPDLASSGKKETAKAAEPAAAAKSADASTAAPVTHIYTLNTKIVPNKKDAEKTLETFQKKRMRARIAEKWVTGKRNYVVQVGEYATEVDAAKDLEVVGGICKCKPTVIRRD